jgi:hypothetical protein
VSKFEWAIAGGPLKRRALNAGQGAEEVRQPLTLLKKRKTAPYGRGSESALSVYSGKQSRDHRERSARRVFQQRPLGIRPLAAYC